MCIMKLSIAKQNRGGMLMTQCPKCQSERIGETRSGCLLLLVIFTTIFFGIQCIVYVSSGALTKNLIGSLVVLTVYAAILFIVWWIYKKKGERYYCVDCQSEFKPENLENIKKGHEKT